MMILAAVLALVFAAVLFTLKRSLESASQDAARARADQIAVALTSDGPEALDEGLFADVGSSVVAQVLDAAGLIVRASPSAPPVILTSDRPPAGQQSNAGLLEVSGAPADYWVVAEGVSGSAGTFVVIAGAFQGPTETTVWSVFRAVAIAWPFIVLLTGMATYFLVGRAFRPVDQITATVSRIRAEDLREQVPVPPSRDEISRLATTMNDMLARLDAGRRVQQQFVGDASHELRSPLAGIIAVLELAVHHPHTLDAGGIESSLLPEARRMHHLINDLLLLATADERGLRPAVTDVDMDDIVHTVVSAARMSEVGRSNRIVTIRAAPIRFRGDQHQLARMLRNLVDNALRYARTTIEVELTADDTGIRLAVADDGPGIPPSDRTRVLDRFVRADQDRSRAAGGAGLGLAIVAEVAAAHGGTVTVGVSGFGGALLAVHLPTPDAPSVEASNR